MDGLRYNWNLSVVNIIIKPLFYLDTQVVRVEGTIILLGSLGEYNFRALLT